MQTVHTTNIQIDGMAFEVTVWQSACQEGYLGFTATSADPEIAFRIAAVPESFSVRYTVLKAIRAIERKLRIDPAMAEVTIDGIEQG